MICLIVLISYKLTKINLKLLVHVVLFSLSALLIELLQPWQPFKTWPLFLQKCLRASVSYGLFSNVALKETIFFISGDIDRCRSDSREKM